LVSGGSPDTPLFDEELVLPCSRLSSYVVLQPHPGVVPHQPRD